MAHTARTHTNVGAPSARIWQSGNRQRLHNAAWAVSTAFLPRYDSHVKYVVLTLGAIAAVGAVLDLLHIRRRNRRAESWPLVSARVHEAAYRKAGRSGWQTDLSYSYEVGGEFYSGEEVRLFSYEHEAELYCDTAEQMRDVAARYNPEDPLDSVLLAGDNRHLPK